jgi:hypothetical protein
MRYTFAALALLVFSSVTSACGTQERDLRLFLVSSNHIVKGPLHPDDSEQANFVLNKSTNESLPFGFVNKEWRNLRMTQQRGDEYFFLRTEDWFFLNGKYVRGTFFTEEYVLVREGCVIGSLLISES